MLTPSEMAKIFLLINGCDSRFSAAANPVELPNGEFRVDGRLLVWAGVFEPHAISLSEALAAVRDVYSEPQSVVAQPGLIVAAVKRARARDSRLYRLRAEITVPEGYAHAHRQFMQVVGSELRAALAAGLSDADALRRAETAGLRAIDYAQPVTAIDCTPAEIQRAKTLVSAYARMATVRSDDES